MSGILDGEGSVVVSNKQTGYSSRVSVAQKPGVILDRMSRILEERQFSASSNRQNGVTNLVVTKHAEIMRMLGVFRPIRLLQRFDEKIFFRWSLPPGSLKVTEVKALGTGLVIGLNTSTHTFFTNGFASHNSNPHDGLQYVCLEYTAVESPASHGKASPDWQKRLALQNGGESRPWRMRGSRQLH